MPESDEPRGDGTRSTEPREALARIDRLSLLSSPSPLYQLDGLSDRCGRPVWIKRDDLTGVGLGGNKTRKLEFLLADAQRRGAQAVVTGGGIQSNHASATAILARRLGLDCHLALAESVPISSPLYDDGGNVAIDRLCGAHIQRYPSGPDTNALIDDLADQVEGETGQRPYVIPVGGSNVTGALGFVRAGLELAAQMEQTATVEQSGAAEQASAPIDTIVLASRSGGTQAGLVVGLALAGLDIEVIGVSVSRRERGLRRIVSPLCEALATEVGLTGIDWDQRIKIDDRFIGEGYGIPSAGTWGAIEAMVEADAVVCDPVYTGKAAHALLSHLGQLDGGNQADGGGPKPSGHLFWHTGGVSGLFAYAEQIDAHHHPGR